MQVLHKNKSWPIPSTESSAQKMPAEKKHHIFISKQARVQSCVTEIHQMQIRLRDADRERADALSRTEAEKKLSRELRVENMRVKEDLYKSSTESDSQKAQIADLRADIQQYVTQVRTS